MKKLALHWKIIIGMILGIIWAILSVQLGWSKFTSDWISPFGTIFINSLKLIAIPLVLFSVMSGIIGIGNPKNLGKMGLRTLGLYLMSTLFAVSLGLILVNTINPGISEDSKRIEHRIEYELWAQQNNMDVKDKQCFICEKENEAIVETVKEKMALDVVSDKVNEKLATAQKTIESGPLQPLVDVVPSNIFFSLNSGSSSMLQIIFFAIFFGLATLFIPEKEGKIIQNFINATNEVFLKMIDFIMLIAPFFVFALMAGVLTDMADGNLNNLIALFKQLSIYTLTVFLGLISMIFIVYPTLLKILTKDFKYFEFFRKIAPAQMLAFSSSSSAATLPVTIECVEENLKVSKKVSGFVLPIGATVNMDGTSLYQAVAAIFLAQFHLIDLSLGQQLTIIITATLASIGSAAVPSAGLVMLMIVLSSVGLNPAWIAIILPVDRILDMVRTTVNVTGDATVAVLIAKMDEKDSLKEKNLIEAP